MRRLALLLSLWVVAAAPAAAQNWPQSPIRLLVGFGAGGGTDIVSRILAQPLSESLGQPVAVENRPGAGSTIASDIVAKAPKDGYTAAMLSPGHTVSAAMFKTLPYDSVKDFAPVAMVADSAFVIVARKDFPADDVKGLVALANKEPGKLNFGSVGVGSTQHFAAELFNQMTAIKVQHVPYRGTPAVVAALLAKQIDYAVELVHAVIGQVNAGELKIIAVGSAERWPTIPNVPTIAESGVPGYAVAGWYGMVFPAGTPQPIVDKTAAALKDILARPATREQLLKVGAVAHFMPTAEFATHLAREVATWKAVREKAGIQSN